MCMACINTWIHYKAFEKHLVFIIVYYLNIVVLEMHLIFARGKERKLHK